MSGLQTVTGSIPASSIVGPVLPHEHLALDLRRTIDREAVLSPKEHSDEISAELTALREEFDLAVVIELTCRGMGRDTDALLRIAQKSQVAVVAASGWYYETFHPEEIRNADVDRLTDELVQDIRGGCGDSGVHPGVIGEVGSHGDHPSEPEVRVLTAAAHAAVETGLSVSTHAQLGAGGIAQLKLLTETGLSAERICIGHQDLLDDPVVHRDIAASGAYVAFDTIGKEKYQSDETRLRLLLALLEAGHADRTLLSCDVSRYGYLRYAGGHGYGGLFRSFLPKMRAAGVGEELIDLMTRRNPLRFLTGDPGPALGVRTPTSGGVSSARVEEGGNG